MTTKTIDTEYANMIGEDALHCPCGNAPHLDGFYCSDLDGTSREGTYGPTKKWDDEHVTCNTCNRVISLTTLEIH